MSGVSVLRDCEPFSCKMFGHFLLLSVTIFKKNYLPGILISAARAVIKNGPTVPLMTCTPRKAKNARSSALWKEKTITGATPWMEAGTIVHQLPKLGFT